MTVFKVFIATASLATALIATTAPSNASDTVLSSKLGISFSGIPVGRLKTTIILSGDQYTVSGSIKTNSMVSIVADTRMGYSANGSISGRNLYPAVQHLTYKNGKRKGTADLTFADSNVIKVSANPKFKYKRGSVPITKEHALNVIDPVSSLVFSLAPDEVVTGESICNRSVPIFDGKNRLDLHFTYKKSEKSKTKGFKGKVYTCAVRYAPVAGHRPHSKSTRFMANRKDIEITMAPVGQTRVYALYGFKVPTRKGTVSGYAKKFKLK